MPIRRILIVMLVLSSLSLPTVGSQGYVTVTSELTSTQAFTVGSKPITSMLLPQTLFDSAFKVNSTTGTKQGCETFNITFVGGQGQYVFGNITSIIPLDFYVMADQSYSDWLQSKSCGNLPASILAERTTTSYQFNVTLPDSGLWDIVLVNYSNTRDANGFMVALLSSASYTFTQAVLSTITTTILNQSTKQTVIPIQSLLLVGSMIATAIAIALITVEIVMRRQRKPMPENLE